MYGRLDGLKLSERCAAVVSVGVCNTETANASSNDIHFLRLRMARMWGCSTVCLPSPDCC